MTITQRDIVGGFPAYSSLGLDPLSFFLGIVFIAFLFIMPRFSHGLHLYPLALSLGTPASPRGLFPSRTDQETQQLFSNNEVSHGLQLDILTQNIFEAIHNHANNNFLTRNE